MVLDGIEYKEFSEYEDTMKKLKSGEIKRVIKKLNLSFTCSSMGYLSDKEFLTFLSKRDDYKSKQQTQKSKQMKTVWKEKKEGTFIPKTKKETTPKKNTTK